MLDPEIVAEVTEQMARESRQRSAEFAQLWWESLDADQRWAVYYWFFWA